MTTLMLYEFRKTMSIKLILLVLTLASQGLYLYGLAAENGNAMVFGMIFLTLLAFGGILLIGINSVLTLHKDMNTKQSYMLFMTPNSSFKILGAKLLENGLSLLLAGGFFFALGTWDLDLLLRKQESLANVFDLFVQMIHAYAPNMDISVTNMMLLCLSVLANWVIIICAAYLADVVSTALLYGKSYNFFVSIVLFMVLSYGISWAVNKLSVLVMNASLTTLFLTQSLFCLVFALIMYYLTALLMERKLSV